MVYYMKDDEEQMREYKKEIKDVRFICVTLMAQEQWR